MEQRFCRRCGQPLSPRDNGSYSCANEHILFSNAAPTVGIFLLDHAGNVLLSVRGINPNKGSLDAIGGFVDAGETFEQALTREIMEETGLADTDYTTPVYLTSATNRYEYGGEDRDVVSCLYVATLHEDAKPRANDDVAELRLLNPRQVTLDQFGTAEDVRAGFGRLLEVLS